ncbi:DNA/RNA non-specific endonuclease [Flavobacterium sp.]|uniref:DNA/RNA non-specific endonuclease n=1 Tax=Flavobacterium sp. TaxID=239 RepID=UPI002FDE8936
MKRLYFLLIIVLFYSCKESRIYEDFLIKSDGVSASDNKLEIDFDFYPTSTTHDIYNRDTYSFSYSEEHEQSEWVAYYLDSDDITAANFDRPFFEQDPLVKTESADWRNYKKSGYDKGHLCPAGDRKRTLEDFVETFFTSNISPQQHDFNSGIWNRLEEKVRYWAVKHDGLYVVTGGVLSDNLKTIGKERVSVPNYFYKVLLSKDWNKMIGFLVPHQDSNKPLYEFVVSVDEIEKLTGIDFYPNLPDKIETQLESKSDYKGWSF